VREWGRGCNSNDWRLWSPGNNDNNAVVVRQNDDVNPNGDDAISGYVLVGRLAFALGAFLTAVEEGEQKGQ